MEREMVDSPMMQRDMAGPMMTVTEDGGGGEGLRGIAPERCHLRAGGRNKD